MTATWVERWYTRRMATTLPRHQVTEIPEVKESLDVARAAWPEEQSATRLIYRLMRIGAEQLQTDPQVALEKRRRELAELSAEHPWPHDDGWLEKQREAWIR